MMPLFRSLCLNCGLLYMRFSDIPHFRRYNSSCRTCVLPPSPISAGTIPLAVHAFPRHPSFPQVHVRLPYMRFSDTLNFRRYNSSCRTCAFPTSLISAGTIPLALHAFPRHPSFPQVQFLLLYMRFSDIPHFRRYNSSCCTCVFPPSPISAGTIPLALHAFFRHSQFPQVHIRLLYMRFSDIPNFRRYKIPAHSKQVDGYNHQYHFMHFQIHKSPRPLSLRRVSAVFSSISVCDLRRHGSHRCG